MANSVHTLLTAYFQYQLDIGAGDIVFDHGSDIKRILSAAESKYANVGMGESRRVPAGAPVRSTQSQSFPSQSSAPPSRQAPPSFQRDAAPPSSAKTGSGGTGSFSKLSKVGAFDSSGLEKFERKSLASMVQQSAKSAVLSPKREKMVALYREVAGCDRCVAAHNRSKVVFGSGSADGKLFIVGYSPEGVDDSAGLPFQGDDGELLGKILGKMGLDRKEDVFAAYIQKCRGDGFDRAGAGVCREILDRQIEIVAPRVLLIFGQPAANFLFENADDIERLRGANHTYGGVPAVVTYSLSLMSKETQYRFGGWDDMKKIMGAIS